MQASVSAGVSARLANMGIVCACLIAVSHSGFYGQMDGASRWLQQIMTWGFGNLPVPFFFLASGYFLAGHVGEVGWWGREARKRVRSLLVPYFLWMVLWSAFAGCLAAARHALAGEALFAGFPATPNAWARVFGVGSFGPPGLWGLWFVRTLFLFVLASPLLLWPIRRGRWWGLALLAALWGLYLFHPYPAAWRDVLGGTALLSLRGLFCFALGLWLRLWPVSLRIGPRLGACLLAAGVVGFALPGLDVRFIRAWVVSQPLALLGLWGLIPARAWPRGFTGLAFPLFLTHLFGIFLVQGAFSAVPALGPLRGTAVQWALHVCGGLGGGLGASWLLRRFAPGFAAVAFGGR